MKNKNYPSKRARPGNPHDKAIKTKNASVRLPGYIRDFLASRDESQSLTVERALCETYKLKRPINARPL